MLLSLPEDSMSRPASATRKDQERFERLRAELRRAFEAPESTYVLLSAADVIARNRS